MKLYFHQWRWNVTLSSLVTWKATPTYSNVLEKPGTELARTHTFAYFYSIWRSYIWKCGMLQVFKRAECSLWIFDNAVTLKSQHIRGLRYNHSSLETSFCCSERQWRNRKQLHHLKLLFVHCHLSLYTPRHCNMLQWNSFYHFSG